MPSTPFAGSRWVNRTGVTLVLLGILLNHWTLAYLAKDGVIESVYVNALIVMLQVTAAGTGAWLWRTGSRTLLASLLLLGTSLALGLLLMEVACRIYLFGGAAFSYAKMQSLLAIGESDLLRRDPDPAIGYAWQPDMDTLAKLVPFSTNAQGLRDQAYPFECPKGVLRIAVAGDSFTTPDGVRLEDAYHTLLEALLTASLGRPVECINFGVSGYYFSQTVATALKKTAPYAPHLLLVGFCAENDMEIRPETAREAPAPDHAERPSARRRPFFECYLRKLVVATRLQFRPPASPPPGDDALAHLRRQFALLKAFGTAQGIPVVVAYLGLGRTDATPIAALAREADLSFVDASGPLAHFSLRQCSIYAPLDMHPNAFAHGIIADRLLGPLRDLLAQMATAEAAPRP